jgi:DNA-binding HxlR family transcriptional regulator
MKRSYKQDCALAHSLDIIGERWTLLIVRELLTGAKRYGELADNLPGMGTNLLATRLKEMAESSLIEKIVSAYQLTETGELLEPVVHALVRFGLAMDVTPQSAYLHRAEWDNVALKALYDPEADDGLEGIYRIELDGTPYCAEIRNRQIRVTQGEGNQPIASVSTSKDVGRRMAAGEQTLSEAVASGEAKIIGSKREAARLMRALGMGHKR